MRIAAANAGRLPEIEPQHLISKKGEVTHIELNATLQKEVTLLAHREYKGGGAGVSVRVAKGVRVRTGGGRGVGYTVIDGTQMQTEDEGILAVSSQRLVFLEQPQDHRGSVHQARGAERLHGRLHSLGLASAAHVDVRRLRRPCRRGLHQRGEF